MPDCHAFVSAPGLAESEAKSKAATAPLSPEAKRAFGRRRCRRALWWLLGTYLSKIPFDHFEFIFFSFLPSIFYIILPVIYVLLRIVAEPILGIYFTYLALRYSRLPRLESFYPLLLLLVAYHGVRAIPYYEINAKSYCAIFREERMRVVKAICAKEVSFPKGAWPGIYYLPPGLEHIALSGGTIEVTCEANRQRAIFYTFRGLFSHWAGLLYQSDDPSPEALGIVDAHEITKLEKNWFFINR